MFRRYFSAVLLTFAAFLALAAGPCDSQSVIVCPDGTEDDGKGVGNCVAAGTSSYTLGVTPAIGNVLGSFYYLGLNSGFVLGNGGIFSTSTSRAGEKFMADATATFGNTPLPTAATVYATETFTAVAVYSATQGALAGVTTYDGLTNSYSDLTGFIVAVGYTLTQSGSYVPLIARFNPRGYLDTTFNSTGYVLGTPGGFTGGAFALFSSVAIDSRGRIVAGGFGNTQPRPGTYASMLQAATDPTYLFYDTVGAQDSFQGIVARYSATGAIDTSFDTQNTRNAPRGSALRGFATSPRATSGSNGGFTGRSANSARFDVVMGVGIDSYDGIFAVGGAASDFPVQAIGGAPGTYVLPFIAHYSSEGVFDAENIGRSTWGNSAGSSTRVLPISSSNAFDFFGIGAAPSATIHREMFTSIAVDSNGRAVVAGVSETSDNVTSNTLLARFRLLNGGTAAAYLALDTDLAGQGYVSSAAAGQHAFITSIAIDYINSRYLISGRTYSGSYRSFVNTINTSGTPVDSALQAAFVPGNVECMTGVAVLTSGGAAQYVAVGSSRDGSTSEHSLIASFTPAGLSANSGFSQDPYADGRLAVPAPVLARPLPPLVSTIPATNSPSTGVQMGINQGGASAYAGGQFERFTAATRSVDGTGVIVVGHSTDSTTSPLTGRSFPILLYYRADGNFPNMADYESFYDLQSAF